MSKLKKIKGHIVNGSIFDRIKYQFSGLKKWEDFKKSDQNFLIQPITSKTKLKLYKDSYLSYLIIRGDFETEEIIFFKKYIKPTDIVIDIGGNIGLFTCLAAEKAKEVHSFEPTPIIFERLKENVQLNQLNNCKLHNKATNNITAKVELKISTKGMDAWNTLGELDEKDDFDTVSVDAISLNDFFLQQKFKPENVKLIKMDVEGWEMNVLMGATDILADKFAPDILIEVTDENLVKNGVDGNRILTYLQDYGYALFELNKGKLVKHIIKKEYDYCNIFCSKNITELTKRNLF